MTFNAHQQRKFTGMLGIGIAALALTAAGCGREQPVTMAPPIAQSAPPMAQGSLPVSAPSADSVFSWHDVPQGQQVPINRASFDQGGYQLYAASGETIVIPFENQNMYVLKFGQTSGGMYFINDGTAPTLYVPRGGALENASAQGARWYPFSQGYNYERPVYVGIAPSWSAFTGMGWYPGMSYYGGYWGYQPGVMFSPMAGLYFNIGGRPYYGWNSYSSYYHSNPYNRVSLTRNYNYNSVGRRSSTTFGSSRSTAGGSGSFGRRSTTGSFGSGRTSGSSFGRGGGASGSSGSFGGGRSSGGTFGGSRPAFGGSGSTRPSGSFGSGSSGYSGSGSRPSGSFGGGSSSRPSFSGGSSRPSFGGGSFGGGRSSGGSFGGDAPAGSAAGGDANKDRAMNNFEFRTGGDWDSTTLYNNGMEVVAAQLFVELQAGRDEWGNPVDGGIFEGADLTAIIRPQEDPLSPFDILPGRLSMEFPGYHLIIENLHPGGYLDQTRIWMNGDDITNRVVDFFVDINAVDDVVSAWITVYKPHWIRRDEVITHTIIG